MFRLTIHIIWLWSYVSISCFVFLVVVMMVETVETQVPGIFPKVGWLIGLENSGI